jgi:hypothetical protein
MLTAERRPALLGLKAKPAGQYRSQYKIKSLSGTPIIADLFFAIIKLRRKVQ